MELGMSCSLSRVRCEMFNPVSMPGVDPASGLAGPRSPAVPPASHPGATFARFSRNLGNPGCFEM